MSKYTLHTMNSNVFRFPGCRLKWQPWSARNVSLETCDKNRIRDCAAKSLGDDKWLPRLGCSRRLGSTSRCPSSPWPLSTFGSWDRLWQLEWGETEPSWRVRFVLRKSIQNTEATRLTKSSNCYIQLIKKTNTF